MAHGMLEYEYWDGIDVAIDEGLAIDTAVTLHTDDFTVRGDWATEAHYPLYLK